MVFLVPADRLIVCIARCLQEKWRQLGTWRSRCREKERALFWISSETQTIRLLITLAQVEVVWSLAILRCLPNCCG